jgi:hypothetical protein
LRACQVGDRTSVPGSRRGTAVGRVAGDGVKADYVDTYDLFHTMEAYFTWYPDGAPA